MKQNMNRVNFGNWYFEQMLGSGGFGQVELWKEKYTNKRLAIKKCMLPKADITEKQMSRWKREIENIKNFKHPNLVKSELIPDEMIFELPVLCMEYCNKGDLRKVLKNPKNACGLIQNEVLTIMKNISSALKYLHLLKITHRDLKPENIVVHEKNGIVIYKIIDLGYAKELGSTPITGSSVGTVNYVALELILKQKYTCSVDYWSLGIIFFEIITGYRPFLPCIHSLLEWIKCMKKKKYEQICTQSIHEDCHNQKQIQFCNYIIYPNDLSKIISTKMVEWFQVVLQLDSVQRGKLPNSNDVVVFSLLEEIFSLKTIYIFSATSYQMDQYNIYSNSTFKELQKRIQKKTLIPILDQVIVERTGKLLTEQNFENLYSINISESIFYVYRNTIFLEISEDCLTNNYDIPKILIRMLENPSAINNNNLLKECYTALIYIMRNEIMLLKEFILAVGTKLDIINNNLNITNKNIKKSLINAETLLSDATAKLSLIEAKIEPNEVNILLNKIQVLPSTIKKLKLKSDYYHSEIKKFFDTEKLLSDFQKYSEKYEECLSSFVTFENIEKRGSFYNINEVSKLTTIFEEFYELKFVYLKDYIKETMINTSETEISKENLENGNKSILEVLNSVIKIIPFYRNQFFKLLNQSSHSKIDPPDISATLNASLSDISTNLYVPDDTEIRDNIVLLNQFMEID